MNKWLDRVFGFSKKEQNGLLVLCILILLVAFLPAIYKVCFPQEVYVVDAPAEAKFSSREKIPSEIDASTTKEDLHEGLPAVEARQLFRFNPNHLPAEQWKKLGFTNRQIQVIHNYENKGGSFRRKEDLQKMYSISAERYRELEPYIDIPEAVKPAFRRYDQPQEQKMAEQKKAIPVIELNAADSATLVDVRGIGPVLASRILQYRSRLGGFRKVEQLREIYGIDSSRYQEIFAQMRVDSSAIKKIYINRVSFEELKKFPYLKYKQMNAIIQYRKQHGRYSSVEDLTKISILDREILRKIASYLVFDD